MTENNLPVREPILRADGLAKAFQGLQALSGFTAAVYPGEIVGLIGPNGAGKTTCFNLLTGFALPSAGRIQFRGQDLAGRSPAAITRLGLGRTFQNIRLFSSLSVLENVLAGAQLRVPFGLWETLTGGPAFERKEALVRQRAEELLALLGLAEFASQPASSLPYGHQRRVEIARALATQPAMLLLDEPAAGMNPAESDGLHRLILDLRQQFKLTLLLVEHDMRLVMNLCDRIIVLNYGQVIAEGRPEAVRSDPQVIAAYLGQDSTAAHA